MFLTYLDSNKIPTYSPLGLALNQRIDTIENKGNLSTVNE